MSRKLSLEAPFSSREERWLRAHATPERIQSALDTFPYRCEDDMLPAACALRAKRAHCFDGCLLAASALRRGDFTPFIIDLCAEEDDDHLLCAYRYRGHWGAVAKSNFPGLRFREPIFRTPRELVLSYFELYFNLTRHKSLRRYSRPVPLPALSRVQWELDRAAPRDILRRLAAAQHHPVLPRGAAPSLNRVDPRLFQSQLYGVDTHGTRRPNHR